MTQPQAPPEAVLQLPPGLTAELLRLVGPSGRDAGPRPLVLEVERRAGQVVRARLQDEAGTISYTLEPVPGWRMSPGELRRCMGGSEEDEDEEGVFLLRGAREGEGEGADAALVVVASASASA